MRAPRSLTVSVCVCMYVESSTHIDLSLFTCRRRGSRVIIIPAFRTRNCYLLEKSTRALRATLICVHEVDSCERICNVIKDNWYCNGNMSKGGSVNVLFYETQMIYTVIVCHECNIICMMPGRILCSSQKYELSRCAIFLPAAHGLTNYILNKSRTYYYVITV